MNHDELRHSVDSAVAEVEAMRSTISEVQERRIAAAQEGSEIKAAFYRFCGFAMTCRKRNEIDWMEMLAEQLNEAAKVLEPTAKFEFDGDGIRRSA